MILQNETGDLHDSQRLQFANLAQLFHVSDVSYCIEPQHQGAGE